MLTHGPSRCGPPGTTIRPLSVQAGHHRAFKGRRSNVTACDGDSRLWSRPGPTLRRHSISSRSTGRSQTEQVAPTPGPPQVRSGLRLGSLPSRTAARALSRSIFSSGIWLASARTAARNEGWWPAAAGASRPFASLDDLIRPRQQRRRDREAEGLGGPFIHWRHRQGRGAGLWAA
jgi:hypothetical protein